MRKKYKKTYHTPTYKAIKKTARILLFGSLFSFVLATFLSGFPVFAFIVNISFPQTSSQLSEVLSRPITAQLNKLSEKEIDIVENEEEYELPEKDLALSEKPSLSIEKIGVETQILEQSLENYEEALKQGVWRIPNFGTPLDRERPIILVAHRFGYLSWDRAYRRANSFFNLPELKVGDKIKIVWDQREFVYEIYQEEEAEDISHYDADLIIYTCKFLKSDTRIFRYAKLI